MPWSTALLLSAVFALAQPRFATASFPGSSDPHSSTPRRMNMERRFSDATAALENRGHSMNWWREWESKAGCVCAILSDRETGMMEGGADVRRPGGGAGMVTTPLPSPLPQGEGEFRAICSPSPCGKGLGGGIRRALLAAGLALVAARHPAFADANALWHIVGEQCVPHQKQDHVPQPCTKVDLAGGYAVLKDLVGNTQFLLIPTARISGIESAEILAPNAPNYWADAWQARTLVEDRALRRLPRDAIGLAINAISGRTQNQLHIHIDCVRLDVRTALREHAAAIGPHWSRFPKPLVGHDYMAMRIEQPDLGAINPFVLLADGVAGARADMAHETLVVIGDSFQGKDGFVLLAGHARPAIGNWGSGEQLLDHACAAATVVAQ